MMEKRFTNGLRSALLGALALVASAASAEVAGRHPDAPPETEQFAFLIGEWDCAIRSMGPSGELGAPARAKWVGRWDLGGWAIRDDWTGYPPGGGTSHGFNIRSFNPRTGKWDNRWLQSGSLEWKYFEAEQVGETMVMTGGEGVDPNGEFVDRNTFFDISPDSWRWRKDRSYDGGKTWIEGVAVIHATRGVAPTSRP
jgi:hypothetical protein